MAEVAMKTSMHRNPVAILAERIDAFENQARGQILRVIGVGNEALHDLDERLANVKAEDWTVDAMRKRFDGLRARADELRANAMKRMSEMPVQLATRTRVPVQNLSRELDRLARFIEPAPVITPTEMAAPVVEAAKATVKAAKKAVEA